MGRSSNRTGSSSGKYRDNGLAISISLIFLVVNAVFSVGLVLSIIKAS